MGGKGRKRREKNYRAAHGNKGGQRLPPPPVASSLDAVPSKLRQLMSFTSPRPTPGPANLSVDSEKKRKRGDLGSDKQDDADKLKSERTADEVEDSDEQHSEHDKRKKKRKRKQVEDLRFAAELGVLGSKRKERKKKVLQERKKKQKKGKAGESMDFPSQEAIRFGEVVQAPPKLTVPKGFKSPHDASKERIRLKAVEAYRNQKGWTSRPGINLPLPMTLVSSAATLHAICNQQKGIEE